MNEVMKIISSRRSVRSFESRPVDRALVDKILECGRCAPNAWGHQSFQFFAVTSRTVLDNLAELTAKYLGGEREEHNFFSAPLVILIADLRENFMRLADAGCAMENMFIAAQSCGLGSVWVNQLSPICDKLEVIETLETLGIAKNCIVTSAGAFGYPAAPPDKKELISKIHYID